MVSIDPPNELPRPDICQFLAFDRYAMNSDVLTFPGTTDVNPVLFASALDPNNFPRWVEFFAQVGANGQDDLGQETPITTLQITFDPFRMLAVNLALLALYSFTRLVVLHRVGDGNFRELLQVSKTANYAESPEDTTLEL